MQNIRSVFLLLAGVTAFAALALFTFSVTLAVSAILALLMVGRALSLKMKAAPVCARGSQDARWSSPCASGTTVAARSSISDRVF